MTMATAFEFTKTNWPIIAPVLLALLATVANGLVKYPQAENFVHLMMDLLSFSTKKSSTGTWKLPLMRSKPPEGCKSYKLRADKAASIVMLLMATSVFQGCSWFKKVSSDTVDCTYGDLKDKVNNLGPTVREILQSGGSGWKEALMSLALEVGQDALDCAVSAILDNYVKHPTVSPEMAPRIDQAKERGADWLTGKKVKS